MHPGEPLLLYPSPLLVAQGLLGGGLVGGEGGGVRPQRTVEAQAFVVVNGGFGPPGDLLGIGLGPGGQCDVAPGRQVGDHLIEVAAPQTSRAEPTRTQGITSFPAGEGGERRFPPLCAGYVSCVLVDAGPAQGGLGQTDGPVTGQNGQVPGRLQLGTLQGQALGVAGQPTLVGLGG